jgi:hypothetical protein
MPLTLELAAFTVREGAEPALLAERPEMLAALRQAFPGALASWLTRQDDGSWLDVILWRSRKEAEEAARRIHQVPKAKRWFRHIAEPKGVRHVEVAHEDCSSFDNSATETDSSGLRRDGSGCLRSIGRAVRSRA